MRIVALAIAVVSITAGFAHAGSVNGYVTGKGTYVAPHYRSDSNGTVQDNYSYRGNTNPYSGSRGSNSYSHDTTSPYFNGTPNSNSRYGHSGNRW